MTDTVEKDATRVALKDMNTGRIEWEIVGDVPFDQVPESPFYTPSPGSFLSTRTWLDTEDGKHVWVAHDCALERRTHILRWPTWQVVNVYEVSPSFSCDDCGLHTFLRIDATEIPTRVTPPAVDQTHQTSRRGPETAREDPPAGTSLLPGRRPGTPGVTR